MNNFIKKSIYEKVNKQFKNIQKIETSQEIIKKKQKHKKKNKEKLLEYSRNYDRNLSEKEKEVKAKCGRELYLRLFKN